MAASNKTVLALLAENEEGRGIQVSLEEAGFKLLMQTSEGDGAGSDRDVDVVLLDLEAQKPAARASLAEACRCQPLADSSVVILFPEHDDAAAEEPSDLKADFHLTKPIRSENLVSIVSAAAENQAQRRRLREDVRRRSSAIGQIVSGQFEIRTPDQARNLSTMLSLACPNSDFVAIGMLELMVNAIEHGNLEIGFDLKTALLECGDWQKEIDSRLVAPKYRDRKASVEFVKTEELIELTVTDEGKGFEPSKYLKAGQFNLTSSHGRGLMIARNSAFSELTYSARGNQVVARIELVGGDAAA